MNKRLESKEIFKLRIKYNRDLQLSIERRHKNGEKYVIFAFDLIFSLFFAHHQHIYSNFRRSIIPNNMNSKPRSNGPISPRELNNSNYNHHQSSSHYNYHPPQQNHTPHTAYHPNLDLINFVSSAWKEKVSKLATI